MIYYYESRFRRADGYYGVVYHWGSDEQEVIDLKSDYFDNPDEAIDAIVQEAEENGLEPLEMG